MTTKLEVAARQALEALETDEQWGFVNKKVLERRLPAITALREALAEQTEPMTDTELINANCRYTTPLMAEQAEPVAVVDEIATRLDGTPIFNGVGKVEIGQKLYAAPVKPVKQKPVAWSISNPKTVQDFSFYQTQTYTKPLYAAPVRTKDLTDDEIDYLIDEACQTQMPYDMFARAVIEAFKEKNK